MKLHCSYYCCPAETSETAMNQTLITIFFHAAFKKRLDSNCTAAWKHRDDLTSFSVTGGTFWLERLVAFAWIYRLRQLPTATPSTLTEHKFPTIYILKEKTPLLGWRFVCIDVVVVLGLFDSKMQNGSLTVTLTLFYVQNADSSFENLMIPLNHQKIMLLWSLSIHDNITFTFHANVRCSSASQGQE